jgi:hypothetical protein
MVHLRSVHAAFFAFAVIVLGWSTAQARTLSLAIRFAGSEVRAAGDVGAKASSNTHGKRRSDQAGESNRVDFFARNDRTLSLIKTNCAFHKSGLQASGAIQITKGNGAKRPDLTPVP